MPAIPELSYGDFARMLHADIRGKRMPISGSLELTHRCNLCCVHCYLDGVHHGMGGLRELSLPELQRILDQVTDAGCLYLLITGGEPLVRPDFAEIWTYAKHKGLLLTLFTNGTLVTDEVADLLARWRPAKVEISLYGATAATYERVTGIPGSFERCLAGIERLVARKLRVVLKTMVMTLNQHELVAIEALANGLGLAFRFDPLMNAGVDGSMAPLAYQLSPEEVVALEMARPWVVDTWERFCEGNLDRHPDPAYLYVCGAGVTSFHIDPYGRLDLCLLAREPGYDLRTGTFAEGWKGAMVGARFQPAPPEYECNQCDLLPLCGHCPALGRLAFGDAGRHSSAACRLGWLRAQALGVSFGSVPRCAAVLQGGDYGAEG